MKTGLILIGHAIVNKDGEFFNGWENEGPMATGGPIWNKKPKVLDVPESANLLVKLKWCGELSMHPVYVDFGP